LSLVLTHISLLPFPQLLKHLCAYGWLVGQRKSVVLLFPGLNNPKNLFRLNPADFFDEPALLGRNRQKSGDVRARHLWYPQCARTHAISSLQWRLPPTSHRGSAPQRSTMICNGLGKSRRRIIRATSAVRRRKTYHPPRDNSPARWSTGAIASDLLSNVFSRTCRRAATPRVSLHRST